MLMAVDAEQTTGHARRVMERGGHTVLETRGGLHAHGLAAEHVDVVRAGWGAS